MIGSSPCQSQAVTRILFVLLLCTLIAPAAARTAKADAAPPPDPTVGGVGPYQPRKTTVQMMSETVLIDVPRSPANIRDPKQIRVNASFTMRNQGQAQEQMQAIFPLTRLNTGGTEQALYRIDTSTFHVKVNGLAVPFTTVTTPPETELMITDMDHGFSPDVEWAAFDVSFPVQQDVLIEVEYEMLNPYGEYGEGFTGITYILETGAGWYGNIGSADITLRLPYPVTEEAVSANPGYVISGNEMHWTLKDFEPTRKDNLEISVIHADVWQEILDLRARVAKNPGDPEAWTELGDRYMDRAFFIQWEGLFMWVNPHFAELALGARQKVIALRPESGEAHYKLAEVLWLGNPSIQSKLSPGRTTATPEPRLDDPAILQALKELGLARSLGTQGSLPGLEWIFPGLDLSADPITTLTLTPTATLTPHPTSTLTPTLTPRPPPTGSSTPFPTVSPISTYTATPSSPPNNFLPIVILGFFIAGGLMMYGVRLLVSGWRSKSGNTE